MRPNSYTIASEEPVARAKYHLALVLRAMPDQLNTKRKEEADELISAAQEIRKKIAPVYPDVLTPTLELECFDYMVSLLAGRWMFKKTSD